MKKAPLKILAISTLVLFGVFFSIQKANANTIASQPDNSSTFIEAFGNFPTAFTTNASISSSNARFRFFISKINDAGYNINVKIGLCTATDLTFTTTGTPTLVDIPISCTINSGDLITISENGSGTSGYNKFLVNSSNQIAFELYDVSPSLFIQNLNTHFISPYSPSNGTTTGSVVVPFSASYFFDDTSSYGILDTVAFDLVDLTKGTPAFRFGQTTISSSGYANFSSSQTLIAGDQYLWHPVMYSSTGSSTSAVSGEYYSLEVLYSSASSTPFIGATVGTSTLPSVTNLLSFLNVPVLLQTKVPFAYIFQISAGIQAGLTSSSTTAIPSSLFFWSGINGSSTIDMFSTTTIGYYISPALMSLWRAFLLVVLTVEFGYGLYHLARHELHI